MFRECLGRFNIVGNSELLQQPTTSSETQLKHSL